MADILGDWYNPKRANDIVSEIRRERINYDEDLTNCYIIGVLKAAYDFMVDRAISAEAQLKKQNSIV